MLAQKSTSVVGKYMFGSSQIVSQHSSSGELRLYKNGSFKISHEDGGSESARETGTYNYDKGTLTLFIVRYDNQGKARKNSTVRYRDTVCFELQKSEFCPHQNVPAWKHKWPCYIKSK